MSENIEFSAEIGKVLNLVINSLYTNKDIFIRELISNASDACEKLKILSLSNNNEEQGDLLIRVHINKDDETITISDNGIGMTKEEMITNLGTIAKSGTMDFMSEVADGNKAMSDLIGKFGVGFYSAFMVSDNVIVRSKKRDSNEAFEWKSDGKISYTIKPIIKDNIGTEVIVHLRKEYIDKYLDIHQVKNILETYSGYVSFPIELREGQGDNEKVNKSDAIWNKNKSDVSEEEYANFYKQISHLPDNPFIRIHNNVEGKINYSSLLFIPSIAPFDLFHPDRITRIKLYAKKIFITDKNADLLPRYLRFAYGVVDSPDLPLNVSRETLQDSNVLSKISDLMVKKILSEIKNKAKSECEEYLKFWKIFGAVIKEGLCESFADRNTILDLCLFKSLESEKFISINEYIDKMNDKQKDIYYLIGDNVEDMKQSAQLETFKKYGINVLFFTDPVDGFWVNVVHDYKGKSLKSVSNVNVDFKEFGEVEKDDLKDSINGVVEEDMIKLFADVLDKKVKAVKITTKLIDSPACLSTQEGAMDIKMERFLVEQKQLSKASQKILEINPKNRLILSAYNKLKEDATKSDGVEILTTIFELTCIAQDEPIQNPSTFVNRINKILNESIV